ncbi:hypothetical protein [Jeotgalicoccus sp. WY2]|uniref:hypothetical protein n=1 Tax=Jeotgalicoccus sp. WY2 TaxID=2708346 RepID=UPI001BD3D757|nr:hypothetical protein [Jeotgalicoccus sp. WY2]
MHREENLIGSMNNHKIFVDDISDIEAGLLILMYFMFKLYKREDYHIARILHRNW